jgi:hypothetical protein
MLIRFIENEDCKFIGATNRVDYNEFVNMLKSVNDITFRDSVYEVSNISFDLHKTDDYVDCINVYCNLI